MKPYPTPAPALAAQAPEDDHALAERDQALASVDQKGSDSDQAAADREQAAADSDQAASDQDLLHGGDPDVHSSSRTMRNRSVQQRRYSAQQRAATADARDQVAQAHDLTAVARDRAAELRDRLLAGDDADDGELSVRAAARTNAAADRALAAEGRERAAADREQSAQDREQSAQDREQAASDRLQAQADRDSLLTQLAAAKTDGLTGTRSRAMGLEDFTHEIDRAQRTMAPLVIAYVDVVGLKAVNDADGHAAGDALLQRAVTAIRDHLRSYDLIVRIGGDEFLTVMSGATMEQARHRFEVIQAALTAGSEPCRIKIGFAALEAEDSAAELIRRADAQLPASSRP